jgi:hypothetical protein
LFQNSLDFGGKRQNSGTRSGTLGMVDLSQTMRKIVPVDERFVNHRKGRVGEQADLALVAFAGQGSWR